MEKWSPREKYHDEQNKSLFCLSFAYWPVDIYTFFDSDTLSTKLHSSVEIVLSKQASLTKQIQQTAVSEEHCLFVIRLEPEWKQN